MQLFLCSVTFVLLLFNISYCTFTRSCYVTQHIDGTGSLIATNSSGFETCNIQQNCVLTDARDLNTSQQVIKGYNRKQWQ